MRLGFGRVIFFTTWLISNALGDDVVYQDGTLSLTWQDWSWSSTIDFAATDLYEGSSSISVTSDAWAALSFRLSQGTFKDYAGLRFDIAVRLRMNGSPYVLSLIWDVSI